MKTKFEIFKIYKKSWQSLNAASHKYNDKRVKMSNQNYEDQMCEKKTKQLLEKKSSHTIVRRI